MWVALQAGRVALQVYRMWGCAAGRQGCAAGIPDVGMFCRYTGGGDMLRVYHVYLHGKASMALTTACASPRATTMRRQIVCSSAANSIFLMSSYV
jgi:hypothetical protein